MKDKYTKTFSISENTHNIPAHDAILLTSSSINAGVGAVLMNGAADKTIVAAGIKALYGTGVAFSS